MSINEKLQGEFSIVEMVAFQLWQNAGPVEREKITQELGRWEGARILEEINKEVNNKHYAEKTNFN